MVVFLLRGPHHGELKQEDDHEELKSEYDHGELKQEDDHGELKPEDDHGELKPEYDYGELKPEDDHGDYVSYIVAVSLVVKEIINHQIPIKLFQNIPHIGLKSNLQLRR
jgi:hypothetical protein